jgi:hypothetical protein
LDPSLFPLSLLEFPHHKPAARLINGSAWMPSAPFSPGVIL